MPSDRSPGTSPPPPVRRNRVKPLMTLASGVLLAGLILIVLINIDPGLDQPPAKNYS